MKRILIAESDGTELAVRLGALGYEVATIATVDEAVAAAADAAADVVLLDLELAGKMDAITAADAIRQRRSVPVLFVGPAAAIRRAGLTELHEFITTPTNDRDLSVTIELALCRHQATRAVHELDAFFSVSADLFCFLDFNGYFRRLNPAWERTLGFTREELMSRPFIEFVHPDDRERTLLQNAQVRSGDRAVHFENRYVCRDGSYRWLLWNAAPQSAERVIYSVARDITARREAEDERARLVRQLETTLAEVRTLQDILPICLYCRRIRDDRDYWDTVENYISRHTRTQFSHGICPSCMASEVEPQLTEFENDSEAG